MTKEKPKTFRRKKCKQCKDWFIPTRTLQMTCDMICAIDYSRAQAKKKLADKEAQEAKKQRAKKREYAKQKREYKDNNYSHQFTLTKKVIQKWVNTIRDAGLPCISCGTTNDVQYCGGHYKTAGGHPELALDTKNISRQCNQYCNMNLSGNISGNKTSHGYTEGILRRYGQERLDYLESYHPPKNYSCAELKAIRAFYSKLIRENNKDDSGLKLVLDEFI